MCSVQMTLFEYLSGNTAHPRPVQESQEESSSADSGDSADSSSPESDGGVVSQGQGDIFLLVFASLCWGKFCALAWHSFVLRPSDPRLTLQLHC